MLLWDSVSREIIIKAFIPTSIICIRAIIGGNLSKKASYVVFLSYFKSNINFNFH